MEPRQETLGRWLRDVAVTIVLLFTGLAVAEALRKGIAPRSLTVYTLALALAQLPTLIWLRHCRVSGVGSRAEVVTFGLLLLVYDLYLDLKPDALREEAWLGFAAIIVVKPFVQRLVERSGLLAGAKRETSD